MTGPSGVPAGTVTAFGGVFNGAVDGPTLTASPTERRSLDEWEFDLK
jgi:hypothetical protein